MSVFAPVFVMMPVSVMCVSGTVVFSGRITFQNNARSSILLPSFAMRIVKRTMTTATRTNLIFHIQYLPLFVIRFLSDLGLKRKKRLNPRSVRRLSNCPRTNRSFYCRPIFAPKYLRNMPHAPCPNGVNFSLLLLRCRRKLP